MLLSPGGPIVQRPIRANLGIFLQVVRAHWNFISTILLTVFRYHLMLYACGSWVGIAKQSRQWDQSCGSPKLLGILSWIR